MHTHQQTRRQFGAALISITLALLCLPAHAQAPFQAQELEFFDIFARRPRDQTMYCLLGNGFFQAPRSGHVKALVADWLKSHPEAQAVPVSIIGEGSNKPVVYLWLIDKGESLNLHLIQNGAFPPEVMFDAVHFGEIAKDSPQQKAIQAGIDAYRKANPTQPPPPAEVPPKRLQPDEAYARFLKQLAGAAQSARSQRLGIWADAAQAADGRSAAP